MISGNNFDLTNPEELQEGFLINRKALSLFRWNNPEEAIGRPLNQMTNYSRGESRRGKVLGVVEDFHYQSLHNEVEPLIMYYDSSAFRKIIVSLEKTDNAIVEEVLGVITSLSPAYKPSYSFIDQDFSLNYENENRLQKLIVIFSFVGAFIATIGVFTMTIFTASEKSKEYSIRKVLGAHEWIITWSLSWIYVKPVLIASILGVPIALLLGKNWINNFEYRISIPPHVFIMSSGITILIVILSTIYQSVRLARRNPVKFLRGE
ncbi:MAG: FtsX-like permease family protein [Bacteroidota bacterium]